MKKNPVCRVITIPPSGACYRACRRAIDIAVHNGRVGVSKTSTYAYRATIIQTKQNTVILDRCYRDCYKQEFKDKWQLIGTMPIDPTQPYD